MATMGRIRAVRVLIAGRLTLAGGEICTQIVRTVAAYITDSRQEAGCIAYDWSVDPLQPGVLNVCEEWESEAALGLHFRHPSYLAMRAHLESFELVGFDVKLYAASSVEAVYTDEGRPKDRIFGVWIGAGPEPGAG